MIWCVFYPWFPSHWQPAPHRLPLFGEYDSADPAVIRYQIALMQWAGIQGAIVSYWPEEHGNAKAVWADIADEMHFPWCYYFEAQPPLTDSDLRHVLKDVLKDAKIWTFEGGYVNRNNKPRLFVFNDANDEGQIRQWQRLASKKFSLSLRALPNWELDRVLGQIEGTDTTLHSYQVNDRWNHIPGHSTMLTAGYWRYDHDEPELERDLNWWRAMLHYAKQVNEPDTVLISWNEYGEQSNIEMDSDGANELLAVKEIWG